MHCYQLLLRIYSTMEVLWMFYSFCGKPLSAQIFWEVCVSFLGCIMHTHNNSSIANTSSFPGCSGLNLDLRDGLSVSWAIRSLKYLRKVLKQNKKQHISGFLAKIQPRCLGQPHQFDVRRAADWISALVHRSPRRVTVNSWGPPKVQQIWLQSRAEKTT